MDEGQKQYRLFLDGDDRGLEAIIRIYKDGLIFYLNTILHNLSAAEGVAEDTFALFGIKRPADRGAASFRTWLYAVGRNLAISYLRKHKNDPAFSLDGLESVSERRCRILQIQQNNGDYAGSKSDDLLFREPFVKKEI